MGTKPRAPQEQNSSAAQSVAAEQNVLLLAAQYPPAGFPLLDNSKQRRDWQEVLIPQYCPAATVDCWTQVREGEETEVVVQS